MFSIRLILRVWIEIGIYTLFKKFTENRVAVEAQLLGFEHSSASCVYNNNVSIVSYKLWEHKSSRHDTLICVVYCIVGTWCFGASRRCNAPRLEGITRVVAVFAPNGKIVIHIIPLKLSTAIVWARKYTVSRLHKETWDLYELLSRLVVVIQIRGFVLYYMWTTVTMLYTFVYMPDLRLK